MPSPYTKIGKSSDAYGADVGFLSDLYQSGLQQGVKASYLQRITNMEPFTLEPPPEHITQEDRRRALEKRARELSGESVLFNEASWQLVLDIIEDGFTIEEINDNPDLPSWSTIRRWIRSSPEREEQYKASRDLSADMLESQLMGLVRFISDKDEVPAAKLKADTLKWIIPRRSRRYMDKVGQELSGPNGAALNPPTLVIAPYEPESPDKD